MKDQSSPPAIVLYDLTSSYFDGEHNELAEHGGNRGGTKGKRQLQAPA